MKKIILLLFLLFSYNKFLLPQTVKGKLIDENSKALFGVQLNLYTPGKEYTATTLTDGSFSFNIVTDVEEENVLPSDYSVSEFYPNPFNPKTRIAITLPNSEEIKAEVFNTIGQKVKDITSEIYSAGTNYLDLELSGLPNGVYISRINIGGKYTIIKKMMLIYGSQHLAENSPTIIPEITKPTNNELQTNLDSLVAASGIMWKKKFVNLPVYTGGTLDLGNLVVERYCEGIPTVTYSGKTYNTVQIGNQCWLRENLDVGIMINSTTSGFQQTNNGIIEKYCYNNNPANCNTYGGLYEWPEAMQYSTTPGTQGICPLGWHIPTRAEFQTLKSAVGNNGNALKSVGQGTGNGQGTNTSGFSALLAGRRHHSGGFHNLGHYSFFWSSTVTNSNSALTLYLNYSDSDINLDYGNKDYGFSVRCVKD